MSMNLFSIRNGLLLMAIGLTTIVRSQLTVQNTLTPEQLVNTVLAGQGVAISNITLNGQPATSINDQIASFNGVNSNIGLNNGVVIATGKAVLVQGPNNYPGLTVSPVNPRNTPDNDLAIVTGSMMQRCVAVLEFDFIPVGDSLQFRFVFGSEEYPEFVCSQYNDGFGFFLSGPGISGPFSNNAVNLARVPGTNIPVAINTINPGTPGVFGGNGSSCTSMDPNWQDNSVYYVNNPLGSPTVELDGFTVPLMAGAQVQCGQQYHIKIAICNTTDGQLDSAVLIEGGSFTSTGSLGVSVETPYGGGGITEGCLPAMVTVTRADTVGDVTIAVEYTGTGITPGDLTGAVGEVLIPAGSTSSSFYVGATEDGVAEGTEQLNIQVTWVSSCGFTVVSTATLDIEEYQPMEIWAEDLVLDCSQDSVPISIQVQGGLGAISTDWGGGASGTTIYVPGMQNGTYTVTATDQCPKSASTTVHVSAGCELIIPNVISPNGDGSNDTWRISTQSPTGYAVKIFNRWGNEVFSAANYANNWKAADMPDGTYFYLITDEGRGERYSGHLTVVGNGRR